jgi:CspA family cold shock protein
MSVTGVVKLFKADSGFGFIKRDDGGKDVFVHAKELKQSGVKGDLGEGDKIQFEVEERDRGPRAVNITRLD